MGIKINYNDYLARFHAELLTDCTLSNLANLQSLHMQHIPFENLDVIRKVPIYLNLERIYQKIVQHNRGGYCYEVNGLFHWLLLKLGYDARLVAGTVKRPTGKWAKEDTHVAILVKLDEIYLVDVGFGVSTLYPITLDGAEQFDGSGTYKVEQQTETSYDLLRKDESHWKVLYRFNTEEKTLVDFHEGCVFNQVSAESSFTHTDLVTRATKNGRITLADQTLIITKNGVQQKSNLTEMEKIDVLKNKFGIKLK